MHWNFTMQKVLPMLRSDTTCQCLNNDRRNVFLEHVPARDIGVADELVVLDDVETKTSRQSGRYSTTNDFALKFSPEIQHKPIRTLLPHCLMDGQSGDHLCLVGFDERGEALQIADYDSIAHVVPYLFCVHCYLK